MRAGLIHMAAALAALAASGCGGDPSATQTTAPARSLEGDAALIAAAQAISDTIGGCVKPADAVVESKVVSLENGAIVLLGCSQTTSSTTSRLFAVYGNEAPKLLSLPDYDASGWFASDQAGMAELDAGTSVLTTYRKSAEDGSCGSEGEYHWDGKRFAVQEMHWQACGTAESKGPPFPIVWPTQQGAAVDPNGATPAP